MYVLVQYGMRIPFNIDIPQDKTAAKRVRIGRRTDDQIVDRIIETKFGGLDIVHRETHTVNGELLRDRIRPRQTRASCWRASWRMLRTTGTS